MEEPNEREIDISTEKISRKIMQIQAIRGSSVWTELMTDKEIGATEEVGEEIEKTECGAD